MRGLLRVLGIGLLLIALAAGASVLAWKRGWIGGAEDPVEVSPEAAAVAEQKLLALRDGGRTARLSGIELSSLLRYRSPQWVTNTVSDPGVEMTGDTLRITGTVATDQLPSHPELDAARAFLPDSSRIEVSGRVSSLPSGRVALLLTDVEVAGLPVPKRYYPRILERVGRKDEADLGENAVAVQLPAGVRSARIENGVLILTP